MILQAQQCRSAHVELPSSRGDDVAAYASAAVMHVHRRPGCSSTGAQRLSAPPGWPTVSTLCRSPDAEAARACTAQRRARSLASGARRACPGWPLSGTSDFTSPDWDMLSKVRARPPVRLDELYTAMAAQNCLRPSCDHEVVATQKLVGFEGPARCTVLPDVLSAAPLHSTHE